MTDSNEPGSGAGQPGMPPGAQQERAGHLQDRLLALLAHELRNPLTTIRNVVTILQMQSNPEPATARALGQLNRQSLQLTRMLEQLLDFAQFLKGKLQLHREALDLGQAVHQVEAVVRPSFAAQDVRLEIALPVAPLPLEADPARLQQILVALLQHALKHTPAGGWVRLEVEPGPEGVFVRMRDNGFGIGPEALPHFFSLGSPDDPDEGHAPGRAGIGLLLARALAQLHGGSVEAASAGSEQGSEFTLLLPSAARQTGPGPPPARPGPAHAGPARVLCVEDDPDIAESLAHLLRDMGHEVRLAYSGPEALALAGAFQPEAVLLDLGLPGMDGHELARRLRQLPGLEAIALVAVSGYGHEEDRRRSRAAGIEHHLVKPVRTVDLMRVLAGLHGPGDKS